jgi:hypothetical protein
MDTLVLAIVLISLLALYAVFCAVQFTYLFARAGLPNGMTYSEYAREGFAQTVAILGINLMLFGLSLRYGDKKRLLTALQGLLLLLTAMMLVSGYVRLWLYIEAYGLTWLRLLSGWFMVYLTAVLLLCAARLVRPKLALIAVCALMLLGWFAALGYANPDAIIGRVNAARAEVQVTPQSNPS